MNFHPLAGTQAAAPAEPLISLCHAPLLWIPLDELRQAWASFGAEALSAPALLATSTAFRALSWEASALHYHGLAAQVWERGGRFQQAAAPWLDGVLVDLGQAVRDWHSVQGWLERLATPRTSQHTAPESSGQLHALAEQVTATQERLRHLLEQIRQERAGVPICRTPAASTTVEEERRVLWPNT
ncbi:MAG TPA: hypothetical protein VJ761_18185 [Ktedonobacteraceae bacterium]|nr:hypothetical protein [Ktedonobacteraceae bacterium]